MGCSSSSEKPQKEQQKAQPPTPREPPRPAANASEIRSKKCIGLHDRLGESTVDGGERFPCFPPEGLVYRIEKDGVTYYYNDTFVYEAHVEHIYPPGSTVQGGKYTTLIILGDGHIKVTAKVYPMQTIEFARGSWSDVRYNVTLAPLSEEYFMEEIADAQEVIDKETRQVEKVAGNETNLEAILAKCVASKIPFVDFDFPPEYASLCRISDPRVLPRLPFMRPTAYLPDKLKNQSNDIIDTICPSSINPGQLGDTWVSSAAGVMAFSEAVIKTLFSAGKAEEKAVGAYRVLMQKNGWFQKVILDNFLPVVSRHTVFASIVDDARELWMSLFQKAFAKVNSSFSVISGGDSLHVIQDFTGATVYRMDNEWAEAVRNPSKAQEMFLSLLKQNGSANVIVLTTPTFGSKSYLDQKHASSAVAEEKFAKVGLRQGTSYLVNRVEKVQKTLLFHVINPWGLTKNWDGAWSDVSAQWRADNEAKLRCKPSWNKPGEFWIAFEDAVNYFDGCGVVYNIANNYQYNVRGTFMQLKPSAILEVRAQQSVDVTLKLTQKDNRGVPIYEPASLLGAILLSVSEEQEPGQQKVMFSTTDHPMKSSSSDDQFYFVADRTVSMNYKFEEGKTYYVIPRLHPGGGAADFDREYVLNISSLVSLESQLNVEVKCLPSDSRIYRNLLCFSQEGIRNVEAEQQIIENNSMKTRVSSILL